MKVTKVYNNNVVGSIDSGGREVVVMGKGIGFHAKLHTLIDEATVEKVYRLPRHGTEHFVKLVEETPYKHITMANEIIDYAKEKLDRTFNKGIYITLTDHISFAIERKKQGYEFKNALLWEIKKFYQDEYQIGLKALDMIEEQLKVRLTEDEAGFIALHIVNAEVDGELKYSMQAPEIIQDILNIVRYSFGISIDETTLSYERFITHLKFLIQRAIQKKTIGENDIEFCEMLLGKYRESSVCAKRIKEYITKKMDYEISEDEMTFLTVHIERIVRREKEEVQVLEK